jgi:hypothetical protein
MPSEEIKIEYYVGGGGQTLRVGVVRGKGLEILVRAFREMATGRVDQIDFSEMEGVSSLQKRREQPLP